MTVFSLISALLFPKHCVGCNQLSSYLCKTCRDDIITYSSPLCPGCGTPIATLGVHPSCKENTSLDGLYALSKHEGSIQKLIKHIKYYGHFDMVPTATNLLFAHLPEKMRHVNAITSVPLHPKRERERGFNQSQMIATSLSRLLHITYKTLLKKIKSTKPQAGLTRKERMMNIAGSFAPVYSPMKHASVLIVDDVTTTRSTLDACAKVLKSAGARHVYAAVLAHGR